MEEFRAIKGYEGMYEVSDLGRVRSLKHGKERILKTSEGTGGYLKVTLHKDASRRIARIHVLVAVAFLNHTQTGTQEFEVDHVNNVKTDNRAINLQVLSCMEHRNKNGCSSQFYGVSWHKRKFKWQACITINGKKKHLGSFTDERAASNAYQTAKAAL